MDNLDFGALGILMLVIQLVLPSIPAVIIGTVGVLAMRKGYRISGGSILGSAAISLFTAVGNVLALRTMDLSAYSSLYVYISQGFGILSYGLLCGGLIGLVISIPKASDRSTPQ